MIKRCSLGCVLLSFCGKVKYILCFCFTQVNAKDLTLMSIVLVQTALRWCLNLPVNYEIVSLSMHSVFKFVCLLNSPSFSKMTLSMAHVSISQTDLAVTSLLSSILIFISHIYGFCLIVIINLSSRLRSLSKRDERGRRAGDSATVRQPSYRGALSFQRLKCVKITTKTRCSHFHQPLPLLVFFSLSLLEHTV